MRSDIVELGVPQYAGGAFSKADAVFRRAVERVEDGNIKSAKSLAADAEILYRKCVIEAISSNIVPTAGRNLKQSKETPKALKRSGISGVDQIRRRLNDQDQLDPAELFIDNCTEINEILTTAGLERLVPLPSAMDPSEAVLISPEIPKVRIISPRADSTVAGTISILAEVSDDSSLADVVFYVDNVKQQFQPIKTKKTQATVTFIWQSSLVTDGKHRIGIKVYDIDGNTNVAAVDIYVKNVLSIAQPDLFVSAHSITRHQNGFVVELSVINKGSAAAEQVLVQDYITPFQPVMRTASLPVKATYYPVYEFTNKRWRCNIECQVSIAPGTTVNFTYAAVPVLMDSNSPSAVIGAPVRLYYQDGTGKKYNKEIQGGITKTSTGTALSTAVLSACQEADYLLVTHPQRLYNQYFSYSVDSLLSHMAQLAVYEQGILGFLEKNDAKHLRDLVKPGGSWAIRMSPQFIKPLGGYLLIVGETEIVPSWTVNIGSTSIRISDAPYSDVSGDEVPDLIVGRIIGDRISTLSKSLLTSIGVYESAGGYNYDRDTAVTISDPGVGPFKKTVQTASTTMKNNGWKTVREIHPQDEFIVTNFLRAVQANDRISSGDVTGDKWAEIIHAKAAADKIYILDYTGKLLNSFNCVFDAGDCLAVGNVSGDSKDEILVADASSDQVSIYNAGGTLLQSIKMTFDAGDAITACDVLGLGNDQIVHADDSKDYIYVVQVTGSGPLTGMSFICAFDQGDILAAGDVMDDSKEEIVVADISLCKIFVRRLDTQNWCSYEHKYPLEKEDRLAVGNVFGKSQHINLVKDQILVLDKSVPRIYMHRWQNNQWVGSGELRAYLNGNDAVAIGDVGDFENTIKEEIIIANGDSITVYDTDRNWVRRTQRKIKTDFKNTDLIYYQGHGNYNVWGSLLNSHHNPGNPEVMFPLDFNQHNPVVISTCCVSGNYEAGTWEYKNIAESFFASGAAVYIGATENSAIYLNREFGKNFYSTWAYNECIGKAYVDFERSFLPVTGDWKAWVTKYNFYGDPKYGVTQPPAEHEPLPRPEKQPKTIYEIKVPDWQIKRHFYQDLDFVEIPGGGILFEEDKPWIPVLTKEFVYPAGLRVQDVLLLEKSGLTRGQEINLPFSPPVLETSVWNPVAGPDNVSGRFPEENFKWDIVENGDGSSSLLLTIFPCTYLAESGEMTFYSDFRFEVPVFENHCFIKRIDSETESYAPGETVSVNFEIANSGRPVDITLSAAIYNYPSEEHICDLHSMELHDIGELLNFSQQWETGDVEPGLYTIKIILKDRAGNLLHEKSELIKLGIENGQVKRFTVDKRDIPAGEPVAFAALFGNIGSLQLSGSVNVVVRNERGETVHSSSWDIEQLPPDDSIGFEGVWDTSNTASGNYQMVCYGQYNSQTSEPERVELTVR